MEEKSIREICEDFLDEAMEYNDLPGLVIGISRQDEEYIGARGVRDMVSQDPLQADDVFHCASVSKLFTSAAIMKLVEAGLLQLNDRLCDILPDVFGEGTLADPHWSSVRLWQMLSHTAGIGDVDDYHWEEARTDETALSDFVRSDEVTGQPLLWEPGKGGFRYSNIAYEILGYIVSEKSGEYLKLAEALESAESQEPAEHPEPLARSVAAGDGSIGRPSATSYEMFVKRFLMEPAGMKDSTMATFERLIDGRHDDDVPGGNALCHGQIGLITEEIRRRNAAYKRESGTLQCDGAGDQRIQRAPQNAACDRKGWRPMALPHEKAADRSIVPVKYYPYTRSHAPSSTLTSTAADLLRWARIHMEGFASVEAGNAGGSAGIRGAEHTAQTVGTEDTAKAVGTGQTPALLSADSYMHMHYEYAEVPNNREKMGLGWFMRRQGGCQLYGHEGTDDGFRASLWICPEQKLAIVVLSNLSGAPVKKLNKKLFERILASSQS